jgi:hypothetical protein
MLDEREAAAAGFFFPEVPVQAQHPHQEEAYHNAIQTLFRTPPAGDFRGIFSNQSLVPPISSIPNVQVNSQKPACSVRGCKRKPAVECGLCKGCCEGRGT